jgi:Zn-dependent protease with chaperone function
MNSDGSSVIGTFSVRERSLATSLSVRANSRADISPIRATRMFPTSIASAFRLPKSAQMAQQSSQKLKDPAEDAHLEAILAHEVAHVHRRSECDTK